MKEKIFYWIPRIFTILAIFFMVMFSFDVFNGNESAGKKLVGFFMSNIPVLILLGILIIAWKREVIGGLLFIIAFIAAGIFYRSFSGNPWSLLVILPFLIAGSLFILHQVLYGKSSAGKKK
jgi:hypothetical protein